MRKPLEFKTRYFPPHLAVHNGMLLDRYTDQDFETERSSKFYQPLLVHNRLLQSLWAENLSTGINLNKFSSFFIQRFGKTQVPSAPEFSLIESLNQSHLALDADWFLPSHDTALSYPGLQALAQAFEHYHGLDTLVFDSAEHFIAELDEIKTLLHRQTQVAILACLEPSKRHVSAFYLCLQEGKPQLYVFDTTGISLPAWPCGLRGYCGQDFFPLIEVLDRCHANAIDLHLMPISTVKSLQRDFSSCLIASLLFFEAMLHQQIIKSLSTGLVQLHGKQVLVDSHLHVYPMSPIPVQYYQITYLPFLVGVQNDMSLMMMLDAIPLDDNQLAQIAKFRGDWTRRRKDYFFDAFWQYAHIALLQWLQNPRAPYPDFAALMQQGAPLRRDVSEFEAKFYAVYGEPHIEAPTTDERLWSLRQRTAKTQTAFDRRLGLVTTSSSEIVAAPKPRILAQLSDQSLWAHRHHSEAQQQAFDQRFGLVIR